MISVTPVSPKEEAAWQRVSRSRGATRRSSRQAPAHDGTLITALGLAAGESPVTGVTAPGVQPDEDVDTATAAGVSAAEDVSFEAVLSDCFLGGSLKTTDITAISPDALRGSSTLNFPVALANVYDQNAEAISFYFSRASFSETSREEEVLNAKDLINQVKPKSSSERDTADLSGDLAMIRKVEGELRASSARFKAIFACSRKQIWLEYDLPICEDVSCVEVGCAFQIGSLATCIGIVHSLLRRYRRKRQSKGLSHPRCGNP